MLTRRPDGNISGEATTVSGNIFLEAMRTAKADLIIIDSCCEGSNVEHCFSDAVLTDKRSRLLNINFFNLGTFDAPIGGETMAWRTFGFDEQARGSPDRHLARSFRISLTGLMRSAIHGTA
jgi:hypothetical protein